ncbi:MAG TPA: M20/M25/M40 family metallo-hydrolase [Anaerolineales bacterium]|nr:M20/M25/M40 family metallo-hydrolase [Anaerolineales bacterium]
MITEISTLLSAAERFKPELTAFLCDLIRIPSVNGRDPEAPLTRRIEEEARRLGLESRLVALEPERPNILVAYGEGADRFVLIAHMDTVTEGDKANWSSPPFAAEVKEGRIIGRGAADNKAGIACSLHTLVLLRDLKLIDPARHQVIVAGVVDEESGANSPLGVRHLLDTGLLQAHGAIYTYTSDIVCIGHRGLLRLELNARGQSIHAGVTEWHNHVRGANAVMALADLLLKLESLQIPSLAPPGFEHLGLTVTPGTIFRGGSFVSIVPDSAKAVVDIRLLPGQSSAEVVELIQKEIRVVEDERAGISFEMNVTVDIPGAAISQHHPLALLAQDYTEAVTGRRWATAGAGPANEGYMLIGAGIPTLCGFGPTGGNPHAPDEWVEIDSLPATIAMFAGIIHDYLKGE